MGLIQFNFRSSVLEKSTNVNILIPTSFEAAEYSARRPDNKKCQTLYLLHGGASNAASYLLNTKIKLYAEERKLAVVMPEVGNSFYSDMVRGPQDFSYISQELPRVMEALFPLSGKRENRFVAGLSMGAQGAFKWALRLPEFFAAAVGMSGVSDYSELARHGANVTSFDDCFGSIDDFGTSDNNLAWLAKKAVKEKADLPRLYCCIGTEDPGFIFTEHYIDLCRGIGLPVTYETGPGVHDYYFWDAYLPKVLDWFQLKNDFVED